MADIGRTEYLLSGTLPQTFTLDMPPSSERTLGCAWWSGAMAPTRHELLGARYRGTPGRRTDGDRGGPGRP